MFLLALSKIMMNLFFLSLLSLLLATGCTATENATMSPKETSSQGISEQQPRTSYQKLSPEEAKMRLTEDPNSVLLDVRTQAEYDAEHIPGSVLLPLQQLEQEASLVIPDKDQPLFVICRSGNRSKTASQQLIDMGYTNVYDIGGIMDWPYETTQK